MGQVEKGGCWEPWRVLADTPIVPTREKLKPSLFVGARYGSSGDAREVFQGDGHANQCVAVAINGAVAERIVADATEIAGLRAENERLVRERDALRTALEKAEAADQHHMNCTECDGEGAPEACAECFPLADDARTARWQALGLNEQSAVTGPPDDYTHELKAAAFRLFSDGPTEQPATNPDAGLPTHEDVRGILRSSEQIVRDDRDTERS